MAQSLFVLGIAVIISWLLAELRAGRVARICMGILSMIGCGIMGAATASVGPMYERLMHRNAMFELSQVAGRGDLPRIKEAVAAYNTTAGSQGSTYIAAMKMYDVLSKGSKPSP